MTKKAIITSLSAVMLLVGGLAGAERAAAHQILSSDLLLPYFEVDLNGSGLTTYASIVNSSPDPVPVRLTVYSNWGIQLLSSAVTLEGHEVFVVNLNRWVLSGQLPDKALAEGDLKHFQAALSGQRSPQDDRYYSTELEPNLAVGYLTIRVEGNPRPDVLFGDYFIVDPASDFAQGEVLVTIDRSVECEGLCDRHGLRFLAGGGFDGGTEVIIWTSRINQPSDSPYFPEERKIATDVLAYREDGEPIDHRQLGLLPLAVVKVSELGLSDPFGWFDLLTEEVSFIAVRYSALNRFSVALQTVCMPFPPDPDPDPDPTARIDIEKSTNGEDADEAPGPTIKVGDPVVWEYVVTNTGNVALSDVVVTDDQGVAVSCPQSSLAVAESMTCTGSGLAVPGQYANVGTATGQPPSGPPVEDSDPSHYFGPDTPTPRAEITIEKATNGEDADAAPGPTLIEGDAVTWTYEVTNTGNVALHNVAVSDNRGVAVSCPQTSLAVGESMTCTGSGIAELGQYANVGTATGTAPDGTPVSDSDPSHYFGVDPGGPDDPKISIEKATNGHDADAAPGPTLTEGAAVTWTYEVTNTGNVALHNVTVSDDRGVAVSCPQSSLAVAESMTCTGSGIAELGQYANVGTATGTAPDGTPVSDSDPSHYFGEPVPGTQGCTPGYWKNHTDSWPPTGLSPSQPITSVFSAAAAYPSIASSSLLQALDFGGGSGVEGAARNLLRAAVAALLNASHAGVSYPRTPFSAVGEVDAALAGGDRDAMLALATSLDRDNNLGCPLN